MPLGIEIVSDVIRILESGEENQIDYINYGVVGLVPKRNEPFVWDNPKAIRDSGGSNNLSVTQLWNNFLEDYEATTTWNDLANISHTETSPRFIADAVVQIASKATSVRSIIPIDNTMSAFHQQALLNAFRSKGCINVELLWRPICIALDHLKMFGRDQYNEGDKILVVDLDSFHPEYTVLEMKLDETGELVPLRNLPTKSDTFDNVSYSARKVKRALIKEIAKGRPALRAQLEAGSAASEFHKYLETGSSDEIWIREGLEYLRFPTEQQWLDEARKMEVKGQTFKDIKRQVRRLQDEHSVRYVLWNGFPARIQKEKMFSNDDLLLNANSVSSGAAEYGCRRDEGLPTYLDTLPGLEVLSLDEAAGTHKFFEVIPPGVVPGGEKVRIPEPLRHFSLEKGTKQFTAVLHNIAQDDFKKLVTELPEIEFGDKHIPLILKAEAIPGQGHALVTIEGGVDHEEVFGRPRVIALDWSSMEDFVFDTYSGPEVYPVRGRIADDPHSLAIAREFATGNYHVGSQFDYPCGRVGYMRIHEPWGYKNPCGAVLRQPTRALFGAMEETDPEIQTLADSIGNHISATVTGAQSRHKYLNYMFRYAPESFREELREIYLKPNPPLNWNTIYAVGRTFYRRTDYEIFLDFMIRKSESAGYPASYTSDEIAAMYWSFFRCLCYYEDSAYAPRPKVEDVLKTIHNYACYCSKNGWPGGKQANIIKYLLSGILFSLRLRRPHRNFLAKDSELYALMETTINNCLPRIQYPPTMFSEPQPDYLNDFVHRFLAEESTEQDLGALQGLVVSMA